jgi:hypothetical protein
MGDPSFAVAESLISNLLKQLLGGDIEEGTPENLMYGISRSVDPSSQ